ncbi:Ldh family oxidoreductase, partial [Streptomonospora salina]|uniref:Ldh family oxidoreductase n=1 Tax=Streptomonospora salina TaxID=104205 RepID=UPI0035EA8374
QNGLPEAFSLNGTVCDGSTGGDDGGDDAGAGRRDDDIGFLAAAVAPDRLREGFGADARALFSAVLSCPPADGDRPVRYPGWHEAELARRRRSDGVPLPEPLLRELDAVADAAGTAPPAVIGGR